jgi:hypothetical protein
MAKMVLKTTLLTVNAVDHSPWCKKAELTIEVEEKDVSTFASLGWTEVLGGMGKTGLAVSYINDMAAAALDSVMWPLIGLVVPWTLKATNAAVSTSNPLYGGNILIKSWTPIAGGPGDVNESSYTWPGSGAPTRVTV